MLSKLLKHEFRNTWRLILILNAAAILLAFCVMLLIRGYDWAEPFMFRGNELFLAWEDFYSLLSSTFIALYIVFMIAANVIVYLFLSMRFYREIYSDAGYLMHALPVTKGQLLWAHLICSGLWLLEFAIVDAICVLIAVSGIPGIYAEFFRAVSEVFTELASWAQAHPLVTVEIIILLLLGFISWIASPLAQMLQTYCAISLGQVFKTHRVIGAVVMYFVISFVTGIVSQVIAFFMMMGFGSTMARIEWMTDAGRAAEYMLGIANIAMVLILLLSAGLCTAYFLVTHHWMKNRLNLE